MIHDYRHLPLGLYQEILAVNGDTTLDELDRQARVIALLDGRDVDEILRLPLADYAELAEQASFLTREDEGDHRLADAYKVGDFNLIPTKDLTKITAGQYIDFQTLTRDGYEGQLAEVLSVVLVPEGKAYGEGYDLGKVQDAIRRDLCVSDVLSILAFFFVKLRQLTANSLTYSRRLTRRIKGRARTEILAKIAQAETLLQGAGAGSPQ
jgi:hypothetical protein